MWEIGRFTFRPIDITSARQIATWQYPPPYDLYSQRFAPIAFRATVATFNQRVLRDNN